jgi:hypothetical protein
LPIPGSNFTESALLQLGFYLKPRSEDGGSTSTYFCKNPRSKTLAQAYDLQPAFVSKPLEIKGLLYHNQRRIASEKR